MAIDRNLPGSPARQRLLRTIAALYASDNRVRAMLVFGSLGRGTWDDYSDLDLAVIVDDGLILDIPAELGRVIAAVAETRPVRRDGGGRRLYRAGIVAPNRRTLSPLIVDAPRRPGRHAVPGRNAGGDAKQL